MKPIHVLLDSKSFCVLRDKFKQAKADSAEEAQALEDLLNAIEEQPIAYKTKPVLIRDKSVTPIADRIVKETVKAWGEAFNEGIPDIPGLKPKRKRRSYVEIKAAKILEKAYPQKRKRRTKAEMALAKLTPAEIRKKARANDTDAQNDDLSPEQQARLSKQADEAQAATVPRETIIGYLIDDVVKPAMSKGQAAGILVPIRYKGRAVSGSPKAWKDSLAAKGINCNEVSFGALGVNSSTPEGYMSVTIM